MTIKKYVSIGMSLAILGSLVLAIPAMADTSAPTQMPGKAWGAGMAGRGRGGMMKPGVFGTVTSVSGNTITINGRQGFSSTTPETTFTVDATNAKVTKNNTAGTISSIVSGDMIAVQGTVTGTDVAATMIRDGVMMMRGGPGKMNPAGGIPKTGTPVATGDGQPVIGGTISTINGSSITITNKSNTQYTIDATNAKITQGPKTITVSDLKVGDSIVAQGATNGTSVTATSVSDQSRPASTNASTTSKAPKGFFGGIGSFFSHLFGF